MKRLVFGEDNIQDIIKELEHIVATHTKYSKSFNWTSRGNASSRRWREQKFYEENDDLELEYADDVVKVTFDYSESCKNVYYKCTIMVNDEKVTIRTIKNLINMLKDAN